MIHKITASGAWALCLDPVPCKYAAPPTEFPLTMQLPGTTAQQQLGEYNTKREAGFLTEKYPFEGQIWLRRTVTIPEPLRGKPCLLYLERTRMTQLRVNGNLIGAEQSLCTPHIYDLTGRLTPETELTLCIKNTDYPTRGGHMTSPDTQTNWIGVTGDMYLEFHENVYLSDLQAYPDAGARSVTVRGVLHGTQEITAKLSAAQSPDPCSGGISYDVPPEVTLSADETGAFSVTIPLPENVPLWSEYDPQCIALYFALPNGETEILAFGLRDFKAADDHFEINGIPVMLRGKHDGLVFPLSGAAPTDIGEWLRVFTLMKKWGINHYRFHTCCPPEAAFYAADTAGIYMEPELPFWGTIDAEGGEKYYPDEQAYLLREGLRICKAFGNHPSFCMFSLGNELWGEAKQLGMFIDTLRAADPRPLYTQGSNNFQHMPLQIPQEDFWTGVRTGKGRLIRGSFADCDAPLGRLQTHAPSTDWDFSDALILHDSAHENGAASGETEIEIQYGTGVRRVKAESHEDDFVPTVPVVTHEVGQYDCYPDYREIEKYKGVVEARNFEIFREKLIAAGMGTQAEEFFRCTGAFSRDCYKNEIEAAMRTPQIAGFQLLDMQDFPGQGTALVGMLNALLENKGFIAPEDWRAFCGDLVPLARFDSFVLEQGAAFRAEIFLRISRPQLRAQTLSLYLDCGTSVQECEFAVPAGAMGLVRLGRFTARLPENLIGSAKLTLALHDENIENAWDLTILPPVSPVPAVITVHSFTEAEPYLQKGARVLLLPDQITEKIEGFYCTDFWNYPMFKTISESMGRKVPVGTMGLCIDPDHPVAKAMFSADHSTPQWYMPVTHSDCAVLDAAPEGFRPIIQTIDHPARAHRLGTVFETAVGVGKLLVCTVRFAEAPDDRSMNRLHHALCDYLQSDAFAPAETLSPALLRKLFG